MTTPLHPQKVSPVDGWYKSIETQRHEEEVHYFVLKQGYLTSKCGRHMLRKPGVRFSGGKNAHCARCTQRLEEDGLRV